MELEGIRHVVRHELRTDSGNDGDTRNKTRRDEKEVTGSGDVMPWSFNEAAAQIL